MAGAEPAIAAAEPDDVANAREEEAFDAGMRQNAMEFDAADANRDTKLSYDEFCAMIREREEGEHTEEELRARFTSIDENNNNRIDLDEYIFFSLRDSLARSSSRVVDLFREWDEDESGSVDLREFRKAIGALGFDAPREEVEAVFKQLDKDGSGSIQYKELNAMLRVGAGSALDAALLPGAAGEISIASENRHALRRGKMSGTKGGVLATSVKLAPAADGQSVVDQLVEILNQNAVRVIDLFRSWDDDGNGKINAKEFRQAITGLGYSAPRADLDKLFSMLDKDGGGEIEYSELNQALRRGNEAMIAPELRAGAAGAIELKAKNKSSRDLAAGVAQEPAPHAWKGRRPMPRFAAHAVAYAAVSAAHMRLAKARREAPPRPPPSPRPTSAAADRGAIPPGHSSDPHRNRWLASAVGPRPHSAPPSLGVTAQHTLEVDIEHCILADLPGGDDANAANAADDAGGGGSEYRRRAEAICGILTHQACVGGGKLVVVCNRGCEDATQKPFGPGLIPGAPSHDGSRCCTGIDGPPFPKCPRCSRGRFGISSYPRTGAFELSLTLIHSPVPSELADDDSKMDEEIFQRVSTPRTYRYGPVRLTSRLASQQWPSDATLIRRFREQVAVLLGTRGGAVPDPWPYHRAGKTLFAHVKNLPTMQGQAAELSPRGKGVLAAPSHREVPKPPNQQQQQKQQGGKPLQKGAPAAPPPPPKPPPPRLRSDRFIRKIDPGVRDLRDSTWEWTDEEAKAYDKAIKAGAVLELESWLGKATINQCRDLYKFKVADALRGALQFRPRRKDDVLNVNLPIASAAGIFSTAPKALRPGG